MPSCVAYLCNNSTSGRNKVQGLSFFRFPLRDSPRCREWVQNVGREGFKPTIHSTLCALHFEEKMFLADLQKQITGIPYRRKNGLIESAVPTKFSRDVNGSWQVGSARRRTGVSGSNSTDSGQGEDRQQCAGRSRGVREHTARRIQRKEQDQMIKQLLQNDEVPKDGKKRKKVVRKKKRQKIPPPHDTKSATSNDHEVPCIIDQPIPTERIVLPLTDPAVIRRILAKDHPYAGACQPKPLDTGKEVSYVEENILEMPEPEVATNGKLLPCPASDGEGSLSDTSQAEEKASQADEDYVPSSTDESEGVSEEEQVTSDQFFLVYEENLQSLMKRCQECGAPIVDKQKRLCGSMVVYTLSCHDGHTTSWSSQPSIGKTPIGNLMFAAATMYTGLTWARIAAFARALNMPILEKSRYNEVQGSILFPVIQEAWQIEKRKVVEERKGKELVVSGDCRCDSPGHNAKYGNYTIMDAGDDADMKDKILEIQVVQCTEVKNSNQMEPEGMKRALNALEADDLRLQSLVTDRHIQVKKIMATEYEHIDHQFDPWHVSKSVVTKLNEKAKLKRNADLLPWIQCVSNHLWWSCATCQGDPQQLKERWISILHHVTNKHRWTGSKKFKRCGHTRLSPEAAKKKEWLKPGSPSFLALQDVVMNKNLLAALPKLTRFCHTGSLEVFHNVILKYCPKRQHFSYEGMTAHAMLAALDWNSLQRIPILAKNGTQEQERVFSKRRRKWVVRNKYKRKSGNQIPGLIGRTLKVQRLKIFLPLIPRPNLAPNISRLEKPSMDEATRSHRTRFKKSN